MKSKILLLVLLVLSVSFISAQTTRPIQFGNSVTINSKILNEEREIFIYLPPNHNNSGEKYPVIYLLDGERHFYYTVELTRALSSFGSIPQAIVVGIPNVNRNRDFSPRPVENQALSGGGDNFLKFLKEELIPYVDKNTKSSPYRILIGHSLTAMYCFYTMLTEPQLFNSFVAASPWIIHNNDFIVDYVEKNINKIDGMKKAIYYSAGSFEQPDFLQKIDQFNKMMAAKAPADLRMNFTMMEREDHGSLVLPTIFNGLRFIYEGLRMNNAIVQSGLDAILNHYKKLSEELGYKINPPEVGLNIAGYYFLQAGNLEEAIAIFKKNVELYAESSNVYDSLGEAFERSGDLKNALKNYEQAFRIGSAEKSPNLHVYKQNLDRVKKQLDI